MANHKAWPDEGEMSRLTVYVPKRIHEKRKDKSKRTDVSVSKIVTGLLLKVSRYL